MITHPEVRRWASVMLTSALRGEMSQEEILKQVHMICENHGSACLEDVIDEILIGAGRIGSGHSDGTFYRH
jgi:adenosylmethionine-8-amino-7-oxononanoate aminotransferase